MHAALTLLTLLAIGLLSIIPFVCLHIKRAGGQRVLQSAPKERYLAQHRTADQYRAWAAHFGFEWIDAYAVRGIDGRFVAVFRHREQPLFFLLDLVRGATHYQFHSVFNREQSLTSTSMIGLVPPSPPGRFVQRFPDADVTALFREHVAAHAFLLANGHVRLTPFPLRVDRAIIEHWQESHAFLIAQPFWQLRTLDWVLLAPRRARNLSVAAQLALRPPPLMPNAAPQAALSSVAPAPDR
jgi:hypothetical protein